MSGRVMRDFRRQAAKMANKTVEAIAPGIQAALTNEQITRQRVDAVEAVLRRPLLGRLRWLFLGR